MAEAPFNPAQSVHIDLARGRVALDAADTRLLIPSAALMALCRSAGHDAIVDFGRLIGTEAGRRVADRLGRNLETASIGQVLEHLGGDLALIGLGSLGLERWGRALVLTVDDSPFGTEGDALLSAVLEGALQRALLRTAGIVAFHRDGGKARFLVISPSVAAKVRDWLKQGAHFGEILVKLNGDARGAA